MLVPPPVLVEDFRPRRRNQQAPAINQVAWTIDDRSVGDGIAFSIASAKRVDPWACCFSLSDMDAESTAQAVVDVAVDNFDVCTKNIGVAAAATVM